MTLRFGVLTPEAWALRGELRDILGGDIVRLTGAWPGGCDAIVDWSGPRGRAARALARLGRRPFRTLRIGPFAAVRPERDPPMSLFVEPADDQAAGGLDVEAQAGLDLVRQLRLAWRNDGRDQLPDAASGACVLVVARRVRAETTALIARARQDAPDAAILVMADAREPADLADEVAREHPGLRPISGINPWAVFDRVSGVYAGDAELGRLARLAPCRVDECAGRDPVALFRDSFLEGAVYLDAWSRRPVPFAEAAGQLAWLRDRFLENDRRSFCVGVSGWKARQIGRFLDGPDGPAVMGASVEAAVAGARRSGGRVVAWETRMPGRLAADCAAAGVPLLRMEDGFLRSVGLGAAFLPGASAVLDGRGIYYDPGGPSDLEHLLATSEFTPELLARAAALRRSVVELRLSKYNVGRASALDDLPAGREIVLAPGQVEDDASIQLGARATRTNLALLEAARRRNPDAYLIFKPHPDVAAGLRPGAAEPETALRHADRVIDDVSIADLLDRVDALETMTSLAGFEALMRGKRVAVHGRPFYAGWGLTDDLHPPEGRTRRLTLDELVAGALILYPRYLDPVTGLRCPPEVLVTRLAQGREAALATSPAAAAARMAYVKARHALLGPIGIALRRARDARRVPPGRDGSP